jgi:hypothetical protein
VWIKRFCQLVLIVTQKEFDDFEIHNLHKFYSATLALGERVSAIRVPMMIFIFQKFPSNTQSKASSSQLFCYSHHLKRPSAISPGVSLIDLASRRSVHRSVNHSTHQIKKGKRERERETKRKNRRYTSHMNQSRARRKKRVFFGMKRRRKPNQISQKKRENLYKKSFETSSILFPCFLCPFFWQSHTHT